MVLKNQTKKLQKLAKKVLTTGFWFGILIERLTGKEYRDGEPGREPKKVLDNRMKAW